MTAKKLQSGVTKAKKAKPREVSADDDWDAMLQQSRPSSVPDGLSTDTPVTSRNPDPAEPEYSTDKIDLNDLVAFLRGNLRITVERGGFTDPNNRRISITLGEHEVTSADLDVVQQREYAG